MSEKWQNSESGSEKTNRDAVEYELNRLDSSIPENKVDLYCEDLAEIPEDEVPGAFRLARRRNLKFKIPTSGQVLEAWESLKFKREDWQGGSSRALDNVRKHGYYTIHSLPAVYMPERWRYLINCLISGNITDEEWIELEQVKQIKVFRPQLRLNEKLAEKISLMQNPDEIVEISRFKHLFEGIIKNV